MPAERRSLDNQVEVRCYAVRRVNPFLGVLQIIETPGGRAISANGVVWDIEVLAERGAAWGSLNQNRNKLAFHRYGLWSLQDGLVSRPLAPHLDTDPLTHKCNTLISCVRDRLDQLPFQLEDNLELWLFDKDRRQPLALLASAIPGSRRPSPEPRYWSSSIGAAGVPSQRRLPGARQLEAMVTQLAGFNICKHWVMRQQDGSGVFESDETMITAASFPPFLLSDDWPETEQKNLVSSYFDWIAPSLLTLQHLSRSQRQRLEKSLTTQAVSVEHHPHLYPEIIEDKYLTAARVQCRLQRAD